MRGAFGLLERGREICVLVPAHQPNSGVVGRSEGADAGQLSVNGSWTRRGVCSRCPCGSSFNHPSSVATTPSAYMVDWKRAREHPSNLKICHFYIAFLTEKEEELNHSTNQLKSPRMRSGWSQFQLLSLNLSNKNEFIPLENEGGDGTVEAKWTQESKGPSDSRYRLGLQDTQLPQTCQVLII